MNLTPFQVARRVGWVVLALLAQTTLAPRLAILGIQPSLLIAVMVLFALKMGSFSAIWTGFAAGLVLDVYMPGVPGGFSLAMATVGWLVGLFNEQRVHTEYFTRVILLGVVCLVHDTIWFLVGRYGFEHLSNFLLRTSAPSAVYTMLFGALLFALRPPVRTERRW